MRKIFYGMALAGALVMMASCGGKKAENPAEESEGEAIVLPVANGEYRAVSFQYDEPDSKRMPFDGRILFSVAPESSNIYVYENGNRTHFKAVVSMSEPFAAEDSVFTAKDIKDQPVEVIKGSAADTLVVVKDGKSVRIAFENAPMREMTAQEALSRISTLLSK